MKILEPLTATAGALALAVVGSAFAPAAAPAQQASDQQIRRQTAGSDASLSISTAQVRQVQQSLNMRGYDAGSVDGNWGPSTQRAVLNFQQAEGLEPTGQLNRRTLAALGLAGGSQDPGQGGMQ